MNAPVTAPALLDHDPSPGFDRKSGLGASEAAAVLGLDSRRTPFALWLEKTGQTPPFLGNEWTRLGHKMEGVIADTYAERFGVALEPCVTTRHPAVPCVFGTPDRSVVGSRRLVECKAVFSPRVMTDFGEDGSSDYPYSHAVQCMVQAAVFDADAVDLAALIGGELRVFHVPRDRDRERRLLDVLAAWWERHIVKGERPAIDDSDAAAEWLKRSHPQDDGSMLDVSDVPEALALLQDVFAAHAAKKEAEVAFDVAKHRAQLVIADQSGLVSHLGKVTWKKAQGSQKTDWKAVCAEAGVPEALIRKHSTTVAGSRRFLVTPQGEVS